MEDFFLYSKFVAGNDDPARILLAKVDTAGAFRQIRVHVNQSPVFVYVFRDVVVVDQCLQFGWTSAPVGWGVCASAVKHAHNRTTFRNAVVTPERLSEMGWSRRNGGRPLGMLR